MMETNDPITNEPASTDGGNRGLFSLGALVALAVLFVALALLGNRLLGGFQLDLTENRQYTLSAGSREVVGEMGEPVTLELFVSESASRELPQLRSYAAWVERLLESFAAASDGSLEVRRVDPAPFSPVEDRAAAFGLQAVPVGAAGDSLYLGIVGTNSLDDSQVIPFLQPSQQAFLEYDIAKMIDTLSHPDRRKVGLLTGLAMEGAFNPQAQSMDEPWVILDQLRQLFEIERIEPGAGALPDDIELLFVVHPADLADDLLYEIDQFVLGGGHLVAFMDPMAETDTGGDPSDPMARMAAGGSSTLGPLLEAWGVEFDPGLAVADAGNALLVTANNGRNVRHVGILGLGAEALDDGDVMTAGLEAINLSSAGALFAVEGATTTFGPLMRSSDQAMLMDTAPLRFLADPTTLLEDFAATGERYALAARVTGPAASAFDGPPAAGGDDAPAAPAHRTEAVEGGINVVLVGDTDILHDRLWVQVRDFLGQPLVTPFADNGNFAVNAVDNLLGSSALISIRTRPALDRPFDRVERIRRTAEARYLETEQRLQAELAETERKLTEIQAARGDDNLTVLNDEQQAEVERYVDERLRIRTELREVQHDLRADIEALGARLRLVNIVLVPLLVAVFGWWFVRRRGGRRGARA